jgi:hypothetical protein
MSAVLILLVISIGLTVFGALAAQHGVDTRDGFVDPRRSPNHVGLE